MFRNKHLIVALLVAPVLAVTAWFAVDHFVAERPHAARDGAAYTLVAKPSCRYASGHCDLENADFRLSIRPTSVTAAGIQLEITSVFPLQGATAGLVNDGVPAAPVSLEAATDDAVLWQGRLALPAGSNSKLRIAVNANGAVWYAEVPTVFLDGRE